MMYEGEKYFASMENVKDVLEKYGVAIIPNVLDEVECESMLNGVWNYFEHLTKNWELPIDRNNEETWREIYKLLPMHSMLFQYWQVGHCQASWDVRQNEKIVEIFSKLWDCKKEDLLASFDGLGFNLPPEVTNKGWNRNKTWFHSDQSFLKKDFECYQSWITALDVNEGDATLAFIEKSHLYHAEMGEKFGIKGNGDWYKLDREHEQFCIDKGCEYKKIKCPKGSLVLWDSRVIHCGTEPMKGRVERNFRCVVYLCYLPRIKLNEKELKKKKKWFEEMRTCGHNGQVFAKMPRTYGRDVPVVNKLEAPILTELGKRLAGVV